MDSARETQLATLVDSHDYDAVLAATLTIVRYHADTEAVDRIQMASHKTCDLFEGRLPGYRRCYAGYHDLRHTLDVVLTTARLLDAHILLGSEAAKTLLLPLIQASLLHDTGYIQEDWDTEGTGAKYSREHEKRSILFAQSHWQDFGIDSGNLLAIARFIESTDLKISFEEIDFETDMEREAGAILGSADLMGQMADREYLEKLLFLYYEFQEAGIPGYQTEFDILRKTREFYGAIKKRLGVTLGDIQREVREHFRVRHMVDRDLYQIAIDRQMNYLDKILADDTTNFRHKLKRVDLEHVGPA